MRKWFPVSLLLSTCALLLLGACATRTPAPVSDRKPPAALASVPAPTNESVPAPLMPAPESTVAPAPPPAPDWRPEFYTVKRGDTLFQIALEHGLDYRELAALNNIENINVIRVGQVLRVRPPMPVDANGSASTGGPQSAPLVTVPPVTDAKPLADAKPVVPPRVDRPNSDSYKTQPKAIRLPYSEQAVAQLQAQPGAGATPASVAGPGTPPTPAAAMPPGAGGAGAPGPASPVGPLASASPGAGVPPTPAPPSGAAADGGDDQVDWSWPVRGKLISGYSESASLKGIDIGGSKGAPVLASAAGRVVYAGSGLRGYGKLVIVKHNKTFLSAYAHLDDISIREGQNVTKGQQIGKMGSSDTDQVKLHFEIRSLGKPVDPMRYLPKG